MWEEHFYDLKLNNVFQEKYFKEKITYFYLLEDKFIYFYANEYLMYKFDTRIRFSETHMFFYRRSFEKFKARVILSKLYCDCKSITFLI